MGGGIVLQDGSVIRTRRRTGKENRKNYSGKNKCHRPLVIAPTDNRADCCGSRGPPRAHLGDHRLSA